MASLKKTFACRSCETVDMIEIELEELEKEDVLLKRAIEKHHTSHPTCDADIFLLETWLLKGILNPIKELVKLAFSGQNNKDG